MITSNENIKNSKSRYLRLSTEDKVTGTQSRFTVDLLSSGGIIDNVKGYIVHSIECPNVFDNIPTYANTLILAKVTGNIIIPVVIPNSYYYLDDFILQLTTSINLALAAVPTTDTVVISKEGIFPNEKIGFTFTGDDYDILFESGSTINSRVGITSEINTSDGALSIVQSIPNLIGESALYVHSRSMAPNNLMEGTGSFSVVDKLNLDKQFGLTCYSNFNNDSTHFKKYFPYESLKTLRTIQITLRNRTGEQLTLPDNFDFTMMVTLFYK